MRSSIGVDGMDGVDGVDDNQSKCTELLLLLTDRGMKVKSVEMTIAAERITQYHREQVFNI